MDSYSSASSASVPKSGEGLPPPHPSEISEDTEPHGPCLRVFLVEDSASIRERLGDFLSEPGKVEMIGFAATEAEAVRQLATQPVDVAIVDLNLKGRQAPGHRVRARAACDAPPTIVSDQLCLPEFEAACRERGADYFFDKSTQFGAVKMLLQSIRRSRH
jgi:DNA-binding NarL/FixJ family response regulator